MTQAALNTQLYQKMFAEGAVSPDFWKSVETAPDSLVICKRGMSRSRHVLSEFPQPPQFPPHVPLQEQPLGQPIHLTPRFFSLWM